jgi:hypothetical protein
MASCLDRKDKKKVARQLQFAQPLTPPFIAGEGTGKGKK